MPQDESCISGGSESLEEYETTLCSVDDDQNLTSSKHARPQTVYDMGGNALSPLGGFDIDKSEDDPVELATDDPLFSSAQLGDTSVAPLRAEFSAEGYGNIDFDPALATHYGPFSLSMYAPQVGNSLRESWPAVAYEARSQSGNGCVQHVQTEHETAQVQDLGTTASDIGQPHATARSKSPKDSAGQGEGSSHSGIPEIIKSDWSVSPMIFPNQLVKTSKQAVDGLVEHSTYAGASDPSAMMPGDVSEPVMAPMALNENANTEELVQQLCDLVLGLNHHWSNEVLHRSPCAAIGGPIHGMSAFEAGMRSLQQCFRGSIPTTVEGILSLVQLALSCAYELYHQDPAFEWQDLLKDIIDWRHAIPSKEDQQYYIRTVYLLWAQRKEPSSLAPVSPSYDIILPSERCPTSEFNSQGAMRVDQPDDPPTSMNDPMTMAEERMLESKKKGKVLRTCARYLNGKSLL